MCFSSSWATFIFFPLEFLDLWALLRYGSFRERCWWSLLCLYKVIQWRSVVQLQWSTCQQGKEGILKIIILKDKIGMFLSVSGFIEMGDCIWPVKHFKTHTKSDFLFLLLVNFLLCLLVLFLGLVLFGAC